MGRLQRDLASEIETTKNRIVHCNTILVDQAHDEWSNLQTRLHDGDTRMFKPMGTESALHLYNRHD